MSIEVLVLGATGQLGTSLDDTLERNISATAVKFLTEDELDLTSRSEVSSVISEIKPSCIINCAAYTAVDRAEEDSDMAYSVNKDAVSYVVEVANRIDARLIHISTDFVFDGEASTPYTPESIARPLGVYGESKLAGEQIITKLIKDKCMIIRTSWLYSEFGQNFVKTMLKLMGEKPSLKVVNDQSGTPTYARGFAQAIWTIIAQRKFIPGIYHWTDNGAISWYDFACAIQEEALVLGLLDHAIVIDPIAAGEYATLATRPAYSVLDSSKLQELIGNKGMDWRKNLQEMLRRYRNIG